jgi:hypothetical protein
LLVPGESAEGLSHDAIGQSEYVDFSPTEEFQRVIEHITSGAGASA